MTLASSSSHYRTVFKILIKTSKFLRHCISLMEFDNRKEDSMNGNYVPPPPASSAFRESTSIFKRPSLRSTPTSLGKRSRSKETSRSRMTLPVSSGLGITALQPQKSGHGDADTVVSLGANEENDEAIKEPLMTDETKDDKVEVEEVPSRPSTASKVMASLGAALEATGDSLKTVASTTFDILTNIVPTGKPVLNEEEMNACEGDFPIKVMRALGVPKSTRHNIYTEACGEVEVLVELGGGTVDAISTVMKWLCGGRKGRDDFLRTTRALCSIHTEVDLNSEVWEKMDSEIMVDLMGDSLFDLSMVNEFTAFDGYIPETYFTKTSQNLERDQKDKTPDFQQEADPAYASVPFALISPAEFPPVFEEEQCSYHQYQPLFMSLPLPQPLEAEAESLQESNPNPNPYANFIQYLDCDCISMQDLPISVPSPIASTLTTTTNYESNPQTAVLSDLDLKETAAKQETEPLEENIQDSEKPQDDNDDIHNYSQEGGDADSFISKISNAISLSNV